jgi:methylenetetrahydrofolate dehydrogenase (NADP+)/methenyltetrahydrofolate cyclohydrolase
VIYLPATAQSILSIIKYYKLDIEDKKIMIVGRSLIVGLPVYYDTPNN